jgi:peptidoglycan/LPS O-acetylase OafA/YrhL
MSAAGELRALTAARGAAAWLVVLFHLRRSLPPLPEPVAAVLAHGYLAVDFFFLLSGFVIWLAYAPAFPDGGRAAVLRFLRRRVARIWPLHLAMLATAAALAAVLTLSGHDASHYPWAALPAHLLLLQGWGAADPLAWNDPAWSISCELAAYLLFVPLVLLLDWRRVPSGAVLAALAALAGLLHLLFALRGADRLGQLIPELGLARCVLEFGAGTALAALWQRWRGDPAMAWRAGLALLAAASLWAAGAAETLTAPATLAALLLALALTAGRRGNPLEGRLPHWLGEVSYATYLSHYLLWSAFKLALVPAPGPVAWPLVAAYLLLVLLASHLLHRGVERPAQRWINSWGASPARAAGSRSAPG